MGGAGRGRYFVSCYLNRLGLPVRDVQAGPLVAGAVAAARRRGDARQLRLLGEEPPEAWMAREERMWAAELRDERRNAGGGGGGGGAAARL